jgi:hypothetical protein
MTAVDPGLGASPAAGNKFFTNNIDETRLAPASLAPDLCHSIWMTIGDDLAIVTIH